VSRRVRGLRRYGDLGHLLRTAVVLAVLAVAHGIGATAQAAESYDNCTGFIDSVPATISTQGTWCLRKDLSTTMATGNAITMAANNVTLDCNGFKLGGLGAGDGSQAVGIRSTDRSNIVVRHCNVRGFNTGINLQGGGGHLVEDNRLDNNLYTGIRVSGDNNRVLRNAVYDTGGTPGTTQGFGIAAAGDVVDNTVSGVFVASTDAFPFGILISGPGQEARNNRVRGLVPSGDGSATGIRAQDSGIRLDGNQIAAALPTDGTGIRGVAGGLFCSNNAVVGYGTTYDGCEHAVDNLPAGP
jgi:parallel beta-helix repeat protein